MRETRSAADPWLGGKAPHVPARIGELPSVCLLPGDPARVGMAAEVLDDFVLLGENREFRLGVGTLHDQKIAVCSTGIGGPSSEIAVVELSRLGVDTFIRVGGMGAMRADIAPGVLTRAALALRDGRTSRLYTNDDEDIPSHADVNAALDDAAAELGHTLTPISVMSCDSYYIGEGRPLPGLEEVARRRLDEVIARGADAMDMECETIFAVARALNRRYGAILATHGNRVTDGWLEDYEPIQKQLLSVACSAAAVLSRDGFAGQPASTQSS